MNTSIHWGILGAGSIAHKFATDLANLADAKLLAIGSRDAGRAQAFAQKHGGERAYGSYAELVHDPDVDVIYVATPHPFHKAHTILCLEHGKAVLANHTEKERQTPSSKEISDEPLEGFCPTPPSRTCESV